MRRNNDRTLSPGESVPSSTPTRSRSSHGYIVLRWRTESGAVRTYEHRVVDGRVTTAESVHHINGIKDDNRPENLAFLTHAEHHAHHRTRDRSELVRLYESGLCVAHAARELGLNEAWAYRALVAEGCRIRPLSEIKELPLDEDLIRSLHAQGVRAKEIARRLGVNSGTIDRRFRKLGLAPFPTGRHSR